MLLNQVDDPIGHAARLEVQQNALLALQLADYEKFAPPMGLQRRKICTRGDQGVDGIRVSLQIVELSANCGVDLAADNSLRFTETQSAVTRRLKWSAGRCVLTLAATANLRGA
jgi:hypothetical protein